VKNKIGITVIFLFLISVISWMSCSSKSVSGKGGKSVTVLFTQTSSYCGGAAPPEELLQSLATPIPLSAEKFCIRKGNKNNPDESPLLELVSGPDGYASFALIPGEYYIVFENKQDRSTFEEYVKIYGKGNDYYGPIDTKCLEEWLVKPELVFIVSETGENSFTINTHKPCSWNSVPCTQYTGPLPP
jgi:hypothetical protein